MSSTTLLLDSPELQRIGLIEKDDHISVFKTCHHGRLYTLTILHGSRKDSISGNHVDQEFEIVRCLDHPNIVKCYEISDRNDGIHVLSEFFTGKSLLGSHVTDESSLSSLTRQILLALSHLHERDLTHGGITPSRFFMDGTRGCAKIAYFGRILQTDAILAQRIKSLGRFRWDLWSLGLSILELYQGSSSTLGTGCNPIYMQTPPEVPSTASAEFKDFISCCLKNDSAEMVTAEQLQRHPFILRNATVNGAHLQGHSLRAKTGVVVSSPASLSPSMSESEAQLAPEPGGSSIGRKNVPEEVSDGKQSIQGFKRSLLDHSFLVQRCAKRKKLKANALTSDTPRVQEKVNDCFGAKSEVSKFWPEKRMGMSEDWGVTLPGADSQFKSIPEHVKSCLLFCSLFPLHYQFDRETLVQLWIAQGLMDMAVAGRMEDYGMACFDMLANEHFIVPSCDITHGEQKYKLNESKACYWYKNGGLQLDRSVHLALDVEEIDSSTFEILENHKHVRTLLFSREYGSSIKQIPRSLFLSLKNLWTLDLSRTHISELPTTVGCLESLRYLNLSYTPIKLLPETIDSVHSLQTLKLRSCFAFQALPEGISNLINLRHLDLDIVRQLTSMPKGMGNLTNLQTLKAFIVGKDDGYCNIGQLKNLNHITGSLCISRLENVLRPEEVIKASLSTKRYLNKLELRWSDATSDEFQPPQEEILEHLQPHYGLKELRIQFYKGSRFPSWISNPSFDTIVSITIYKCTECQFLPSLGHLPALKFLIFNGLNSVKDLTGLFGRNRETSVHYAFPKLENLTLDNMLHLQQLTGAENGDFPCLVHVFIRYCPQLFDLSLLSHLKMLKNLEISHCNELQSLPEVGFPPSIESLRIRCCPNIRQRYQKNAGQDWSKIAHIPRIWIDYEEISCNI